MILLDVSQEILDQARETIRNSIRFQGLFTKDKKTNNLGEVLERISLTTDSSALSAADFVIENVTEKLDIKKDVYSNIDRICPERAIFGVNTSAISITRIAALTRRPAKVIGVHFMNPVPLKTTVEVIRGFHTSDETLEHTRRLLSQMGKDCIIVKDSPGFVSNRVLMLTVNEAIFLLQEQAATAEEIDRIFTACFGHKMGPLATADLIGLDTVLYSLEQLHEAYADSKYRACPLLRKMVDAGLYGRKSGQGFFKYDGAVSDKL